MTEYLLFEEHAYDDAAAFVYVDTIEARSGEEAIRELASSREYHEQRNFFATPRRSWKGLRVGTKVTVSTEKLEDLPPAMPKEAKTVGEPEAETKASEGEPVPF